MPRRQLQPPSEPRRTIGRFGKLAALGCAGLLCVTLLSAAPGAHAAGFDLAQLTKSLAANRAGEATFVERREVAVLDRTLVSSGRLSFEAPDGFVRETLKPRRERMAVAGNTLTLSSGSRTRTLELDSSPEAAVIVEAIRGTLTGNRDALERLFSATVGGTPERWSLDLVPRDARLRGQVASVRVAGTPAVVREVVVWLADGDRSVMTIEPVGAAGPKGSADTAKPVGASGAAR
ncbi:MAG: LolA-related protein [Caldimonas sp.]